jgi:hypothetical protein
MVFVGTSGRKVKCTKKFANHSHDIGFETDRERLVERIKKLIDYAFRKILAL